MKKKILCRWFGNGVSEIHYAWWKSIKKKKNDSCFSKELVYQMVNGKKYRNEVKKQKKKKIRRRKVYGLYGKNVVVVWKR